MCSKRAVMVEVRDVRSTFISVRPIGSKQSFSRLSLRCIDSFPGKTRIRRPSGLTVQIPGLITALEEEIESMVPNDSTEPESTLPEDDSSSWMDSRKVYDDSDCGRPQCLRRTRPHMLAYFSSPPEEGQERKPDQYKPHGSHPLCKMIERTQKVQDLDHTLEAIAESCDLQTKFKAIQRVYEWREEQLILMYAEKHLEDDRRLAADSCRETMQELLRLHNVEGEKWKVEKEKWRVERDSWKLTCKRLKDEACAREQQLRKLTMESQRWKSEFTRLASAEAEGKNVAEICRDLLEQLHVEQQSLDLQRRTEDSQKASNSRAPTGKLERPSDGMSGQSLQSQRDERKGKCNKPEKEDWVSQEELMQFNQERQRWLADAVKLRAAESEGKKLEEVCRDLIDQLHLRNEEIQRIKVELEKASEWQALSQRQLWEQRDEIKKLKHMEVSECIICTNEFGEDLDRQRAYWKNCNHANICYQCTKTLWSSQNRQCPTCKTLASSMPTRLPPKIYL